MLIKMYATCVFVFLLFSQGFAQFLGNKLAVAYVKNKILTAIDETVDNDCRTDLKLLLSGWKNKETWALKMLDSSAKIGPEFLKGDIFQVGNFDQCLDINEIVEGHEMIGKYCNSFLKPKKNISWNTLGLSQDLINQLNSSSDQLQGVFDICLPQSCKEQDFVNFWKNLNTKISLPVNATISEEHCQYKNKPIGANSTDIFVL